MFSALTLGIYSQQIATKYNVFFRNLKICFFLIPIIKQSQLCFFNFTQNIRSMKSKIAYWILNLFGWSIVGETNIPGVKKYIVVVVPHTSNWDFPLGILTRNARQIDIRFFAKASLFKWPFGGLFKAMGGYPVDRSGNVGMVDALAQIFIDNDELYSAIAPEGTRAKVDKLKTGFWYVAKKAEIPMLPASFDYPTKRIIFGDLVYPSNDIEADLQVLYKFYKGKHGKIPANEMEYPIK